MRAGGRIDTDAAIAGRVVLSPAMTGAPAISNGNGAGVSASALERSRRFCEHLTRTQARNFYYGLKLLPEPKRSAMYALYAYMRLVDDIADDGRSPEQREEDLEVWREQTHDVIAGRTRDVGAYTGHQIWPAFADMVRRHGLPTRVLDDVIAGQRQDLRPVALENFDQLYEYCYRVAGTVGLASIYVWGFEGGEATELLAVERGVAFQLTNILRDLREDASRGRTYLPSEDLAAHGVTPEDLSSGRGGEGFRRLMRAQIAKAEYYYERSQALESRVHRDARPTLVAMTDIYRRILRKVAADPERVLRERVSLSLLSKLRIGWRASRVK